MRREEILRKANEQARDILQDAKKDADDLIAEMRRSGRGGDLSEMERTRSALREKVSAKNSRLQRAPEKRSGERPRPEDLKEGDSVRIISMGMTGVVVSLPDKNGKLQVRIGNLHSQVRLSDLELVSSSASQSLSSSSSGKKGSSMRRAFQNPNSPGYSGSGGISSGYRSVSPELNLIGLTVDEALNRLDKYLDDARLSHLDSVRIVHGKGTGALRGAVTNYLKKQPGIRYRAGDFGEGDAGVTIVSF